MIFSGKTKAVFDHSRDIYHWRKTRQSVAPCRRSKAGVIHKNQLCLGL